MNKDSQICKCSHEQQQHSSDNIKIIQEKSKCCTEKSIELTNSNSLSILKKESPQNIQNLGYNLINIFHDIAFTSFPALFFHDSILISHEIPILVSSLLI